MRTRAAWITPCAFLACAHPPGKSEPVTIAPFYRATVDHCVMEETAEQKRARYFDAIGACDEPDDPPSSAPLRAANSVDVQRLQEMLAKYRPRIARCFDEADLVWWPDYSPVLSRLDVDDRGIVRAAHVIEEHPTHREIGCCVRRELRRAELPALGSSISVLHRAERDRPEDCRDRCEQAYPHVQEVVLEHRSQVGYCAGYENWRQGKPAAGRITVEFMIAPDGSVPLTRLVEDELHHRQLSCCVMNMLRGTHFPPSRDGAPITMQQCFRFNASP